jgi:hypothetical protein
MRIVAGHGLMALAAVLVPGAAWAGSIEIERGVAGAPGASVTWPGAQGVDGSVVVAGDPATQPVAYVTADVGVWVIDPITNEPFALIPLPEQPEFLSLSPDARTLLATAESSTIHVIDTTARRVRASIVDQPSYVAGAFSPDGALAYVVRFGLTDPVSGVSSSWPGHRTSWSDRCRSSVRSTSATTTPRSEPPIVSISASTTPSAATSRCGRPGAALGRR